MILGFPLKQYRAMPLFSSTFSFSVSKFAVFCQLKYRPYDCHHDICFVSIRVVVNTLSDAAKDCNLQERQIQEFNCEHMSQYVNLENTKAKPLQEDPR